MAAPQCEAAAVWKAPKKITLAERYPGREMLLKIPDKRLYIQARFYLAGDRAYNVVASGSKWWLETAGPKRFLESLRLVE